MAIRLELPIPPSANNSYPGVIRRYPSQRLRQWKIDAGWELKMQKPGRIFGPYNFTLHVPVTMRGDVDGRAKAPLDLCVEHHVTDDDRFAQSATVIRTFGIEKGRCVVLIEAAP